MIKAVLFDLGGTIHTCSTNDARRAWFARRLLDRLAEYGLRLDLTETALSAQLTRNAEIYKHMSEQSLRELSPVEIWNDYYLKEQRLGRAALEPIAEELSFLYDYERVCNLRRPNLIACMEALKAQGLRLGVISNIISRTIVPHFMAEYGLDRYMDVVLTSAQTGIRKPSAEIFKMAERAMDLPPDALGYVGDTLSRDVLGVRNAGWRMVIQIDNPSSRHRDAALLDTDLKPDAKITDLGEIPDIIRSINEREGSACM